MNEGASSLYVIVFEPAPFFGLGVHCFPFLLLELGIALDKHSFRGKHSAINSQIEMHK
jgi:hypothetical protein